MEQEVTALATIQRATSIQTVTIETRARGDVGGNDVSKWVVSDLLNDVAAWPEVIDHNLKVNLVKTGPRKRSSIWLRHHNIWR